MFERILATHSDPYEFATNSTNLFLELVLTSVSFAVPSLYAHFSASLKGARFAFGDFGPAAAAPDAMAEKSKASNEPWSPSCLNDFWSLLGCEDEKLKQLLSRRRCQALGLRGHRQGLPFPLK